MTRPLTSAERQRLRSPANLLRALIPLLVLVVALVILVWPRGQTSDGVHVIDPTSTIQLAHVQGGFTPLSPTRLPSTWRATSADLPPSSTGGIGLRIGFVSPTGKYAELLESKDAPDAVAAEYGPLSGAPAVAVGSSSWEGFTRSDGRQLLRHTAAGVTVIVTGSASQAELVQLAGSLT